MKLGMLTRTIMVGLVVSFCMSVVANAATLWWGNGKYEWQENSWHPSTTNDTVIIGGHVVHHPTTNATINVCHTFKINDYSGTPVDFSVVDGKLSCSQQMEINSSSAIQNVIRLIGGAVSNKVGVYVYDNYGMTNTLQVVGSGCTLEGSWSVNLNKGASGSAGQIEFVIDGTGISAIPGNLNFNDSTASISLVCDGASPGTYTLVNGSIGNPVNITWRLADPSPYTWVTDNFVANGTVGLVDLRPKGTVVSVK